MAHTFNRKVARRARTAVGAFGVLILAGAGVAQARPTFMPLGEATLAPQGFLRFCQVQPQQCGLAGQPASGAPGSGKQLMQQQWADFFGIAPPAAAAVSAQPADAVAQAPEAQAPEAQAPSQKALMSRQWAALFGVAEPATAAVTAPVAHSEDAPAGVADGDALAIAPANQPLDHYTVALSLPTQTDEPALMESAEAIGGDPAAIRLGRWTPGDAAATGLDLAPAEAAPVLERLDFDRASTAPQPALIVAVEPEPAPPQDPALAAEPLQLTGALLEQLSAVNGRVNAAITPMSDVEAFGANDVWALPIEDGSAKGNCKHYALEKQHALIAAGVPAADLSLAIVRTSWGEMHAVLLVSTDQGELVLDNLRSAIVAWRDEDYTWIERQKPGDPMTWVTVAQAD